MNCDFWSKAREKSSCFLVIFILFSWKQILYILIIFTFKIRKKKPHNFTQTFCCKSRCICISQNTLGKPLPQKLVQLMTKEGYSNSVVFCRAIRCKCNCSMTRFISLFTLSLVKWQLCFRRPYMTVSPSSGSEDEPIIGEILVEITDFWCLNITCGLYANLVASRMF